MSKEKKNPVEENIEKVAEFQEKVTEQVAQFQEQAVEFQQKVMETAANAMKNFDPQKFTDEVFTMQDNMLKGMDVLLNIKPEDVASDTLEKDVVLSIGKMRLFHYKPLVAARKRVKTPMMITYALVNRQYMMDLQPDRSLIKSFLEAGLDVYIVDWGYPTGEDMYMTLDDHINWYMDDAVDYIRKESGKDAITLLGVCQGATFSTIYTAMHPEKVKNLVAMVVPIDFSGNEGLLFRWSKFMNIDAIVDAYDGLIPADTMNFSYLLLKPLGNMVQKYVGMVDKWADPDFTKNFLRMEKWVFDSPAQIGATLSQFVKDLYQDNKLMKGTLELGGKVADLKNISQPVLVAVAEKDHIVPPSSSRPLIDAISSTDKQYMSFNTGHIGMYTSSKSQKDIVPSIVEWIKSRS